MPKLYFKVATDWEKVVKLREEIERLKSELLGMNSSQYPAAFNTLNRQLQQSTHELQGLSQKAAQAGAEMEGNLKNKIFAASQGVNSFTEKIIAQKAVVRDVQEDVRKLGDAYREAAKKSPMMAEGKLAEWRSKKTALEEEKAALFGLTQEQAKARLSVKKLSDEYSLFKNEGSQATSMIGSMAEQLKTASMGIIGGLGLKELGSHIINIRSQFESMETSLKVLLGGNQERLNNVMTDVKAYALASPLNTKDMVGAVQMMTSFGLEAEKSVVYLKAMGDISMGNTDKFNSLVLAFSQMSSAGKLMGQDLNQMINAGFNPLEEISRKTGKSIGELKNEMSEGAISSKMVQDAFISATSAGGRFFGMSKKGAETLNGQISMLQESLDNMFNEIGKKGEGAVMGVVQAGTYLISNYEQVGKILVGLVVTYGTYRTALILSTQVTNGMTMAQVLHTTATKALTAAEAALNKTILANPYVLAAVALGTLITAVVLAGDSMTAAERAQDNYNKKIEENSKLVKDEKTEIDRLIGTLEDETSSIDSKNIAFSTLISKYPTIFGKYKTEKDLIDHLTEARQRENAEIERKTTLLGQKSYNESKTRATELNRLKYLQENGDIKGRQTQSGYKEGKDQDEYLRLWYKYHDDIKKTQTWYGTENSAIDRMASVATEEHKLNINENRKAQIAKYNANVGNLSKVQAQKELARLRSDLEQMDKSGKNYLKIGNNEPLSREQIKERITLLENNVKTERKTMAQWRKEAEKETKKNRKAGKDLASSTELLTKDQAEKKMKAANDTLAASEKSEKNFDIQDKSGAKAERERKQQIKDANAHQKAINDLDNKKIAKSQAEIELDNQLEQSYIDSLMEGSEKTIAARNLAHKKEMEQIDKQEQEYLKTKQEEAKAEFEANPKNKDKTFDTSSITLSKKDQAKFNAMRENAKVKQDNEDRKAQQDSVNALNNYLKEYGSMQEKRLAIAQEYDLKIQNAQTEGERLSMLAEKDKTLKSFDADSEKKDLNWEEIFGNLSNYSVKQLEEIKVQLREMLSSKNLDLQGYKTAVEQIDKVNQSIIDAQDKQHPFFNFATEYSKKRRELELNVADAIKEQNKWYNKSLEATAGVNLKRQKLKESLDEKDFKDSSTLNSSNAEDILAKAGDKYGLGTEKYKEVQQALEDLAKSEIDLKDANGKKLASDKNVEDAKGKQLKLSKDFSKGLGGFMNVLDIVNSNVQELPGLLDRLGVDKNSAAAQAVDNFSKSTSSAFGAIKDLFSLNFVGVINKSIDQVGYMINAGLSLFGGLESDPHLKEDLEKLSASNDALMKAVDALAKKMKEGSVADATDLYNKQIEDIKKSQANTQEELLRSGAASSSGYKGERSSDYRINKGMNANDWKRISNEVGKSVTSAYDFWHLSSEEMYKVSAGVGDVYAKIKGLADDGHRDAAQFMDSYINFWQQLQTAEDTYNEKMTSVSFDTIVSDFENGLMNMDSDAAALGDNVEKYLRQAVVSALASNTYQPLLNNWYKAFAQLSIGGLTPEEVDMLKNTGGTYFDKDTNTNVSFESWAKIIKDAKNDVDTVTGALGLDTTSSQNATANGISSISYDQANNLVGQITSMEIAVQQGNDKLDVGNERLSLINMTIEDIKKAVTNQSYGIMPAVNNIALPQISVVFPDGKIDELKIEVSQLKDIVDEMRNQNAESVMERKIVSDNTDVLVKGSKTVISHMEDIKNKIKSI